MHVTTRGGGKILTRKAKDYFRDARALINLAIEEQRWIKPETAVWLYVDLVFYMPDRRIRDSHNCIKILMDVMQDVVFVNDFYVMPRVQSVEYNPEHPRVEVLVSMQQERHRTRGIQMTSID